MTKNRAKQYWRILKNAKDCSTAESAILAEAIRVMNTPAYNRLRNKLIRQMSAFSTESIIFHCLGHGYPVTEKEVKKILKRA